MAESTRVMGKFLRDTVKLNMESRNFRLFSPDENNSNRWQDAMEVTNRAWMAERYPYDDHLAPDGRVMEMLSEHQCQGWLEGYLLTGRHGFFSCYEAFIHIIDSMFNQHAKWLKVCHEIPWRRPIASLNYLLSSHVWRQDHNGFSHQDPGFIDHVINKKAEVVRVYLPPDANTLLSVTDHCLRSRNYVNVVVAGKQPAPQWLTMDGGHLATSGRVMEMLSEHTVEGWLEGYILSGRHGLINSYEPFIHVVDSMFNQHAKWLEKCSELSWRAPISSLNLLITGLVWRQDHNGFTHQDPGFLDVVANKSPEAVRIYLPPDANSLLSVADHCLRSVNYVNVIVADKKEHIQFLDMDAAIAHCTKGIGIWSRASNDQGVEPDVVMASCGDVPTTESLAATALLRQHLPDAKIRFVNVVDLFRLVPHTEHPHGMTDREFEAIFTPDKPVVFNFHGYPWLIHRLTYRRPGQHNIHVRGYKEQGNINTPLELAICNQTDRFSLAIDAIDRMPRFHVTGAGVREALINQQIACKQHAYEFGIDPPEITDWKWPF